jgi:hypothetical protein
MKYIYEIVDATDDDVYYPLGMYEDPSVCKKMLIEADENESFSYMSNDENETIEIRQYPLNEYTEKPKCVFAINRQRLDDDWDNDLKEVWVTTITTDLLDLINKE